MSRNYDASQLTVRKMERTIAGSFLSTAGVSPNNYTWGSRPLLGIKDQSIINAVRTGQMTEYTRYPTCVGISPGCPCPVLQTSSINIPTVPGVISGITFTIGSIIVSWNTPTCVGPFIYTITPYLNGIAQAPVTTLQTTYRFSDVHPWQSYTFTICASNASGQGPVCQAATMLAPPEELSLILMGGHSLPLDIAPSIMYLVNMGLDNVFAYCASINLGATLASRLLYLWSTSVVQAWNWVCSDSRVKGEHDQWNWDWNPIIGAIPPGLSAPLAQLSDSDCIIWLCTVINYITSLLIPGPPLCIYNTSPLDVTRVKTSGNWNTWVSQWNTWYQYRTNDGSAAAKTTMPIPTATATMPVSSTLLNGAQNWNKTIVVDGVTQNPISTYPSPQQWTRLTIQGTEQKYLTWLWDTIQSTCLQSANEQLIVAQIGTPKTGAERNTEIDSIIQFTQQLTDFQKIQAEFWSGSAIGSISPPLMSAWLWKEYVRSMPMSCPVIMFSLLDLCVHLLEGGRVTWGIKGMYMQDRPIQEIRRRYTGHSIPSWNGMVDGSQWIPYQRPNFVTPPFPDFISGHSNFTKGFALTMNKWFGSDIIKNSISYDNLPLMASLFTSSQTAQYGDFIISPGSSSIQPSITPAHPVIFSFKTWDEIANAAGISRLYGGIHTITAHTAAQASAILIDQYINETWNILTN